MTRRRRPLRFRLAASALVLVGVALIAEAGARWFGAEVPEWKLVDAAGVVMTGHPTRLWGLSPGIKQNGDATATINDLGLRGPKPETQKPPGRLRVLVLGDSTFFGHGVSDDATFPAQLEQHLRADGLDAEVVDAAVPGYSTEQSRLLLDEVGFSLDPDLLLVGNLWSDNNVDSFRDADLLATAKASRENPLFASYFFRLLATAVDRARGGTGAHLVTWTRESRWPEKGDRRVPLRRYGENLSAMALEAAERGVGTAFVGPCNIGMVDGRYPDGASWDVYFDAQKRVAAHHGVPWIPTVDAMRAAGGSDPSALFVDVMHPSKAGHGVFAETVERALLDAGWPKARLVATGGPFPADTLDDSRFGIGTPNPASPQKNLFGAVREMGPPEVGGGKPTAADEGSAGGGPRQHGTAVAPGGGAPGGGAPVGAVLAPQQSQWAVTGRIEGGKAPILVELRGTAGSTVSSARLAEPGAFTLRVRRDVERVEVRATDAAGATATAAAEPGSGEVVLELK